MKVTLGEKLGAGLEKLRLKLPVHNDAPEGISVPGNGNSPQPLVGVVVPDHVPHEPKRVIPSGPLHIRLRHQPPIDEPFEPLPELDEGQAVGEFIEWMDKKGMLPPEFSSNYDFAKNGKNREKLQQWYFEERGQ